MLNIALLLLFIAILQFYCIYLQRVTFNNIANILI